MSSPKGFTIVVKRIYDGLHHHDGYRILVDRLWPRGIRKEDAQIELWMKDIAPSQELRTWFRHDPEKWGPFQKRYFKELDTKQALLTILAQKMQQGPITLLYAAKQTSCNHAVALKNYLLTRSL